ncbi:MAG: hypothetical protein JOZ37_09830 [Actinobacteria bacterium]|nr:hypothetical protein [Actinomycetota bacterium]MBV8958666.1 hypothetical protein [Actinomycetota bacterium]MBV9255390.1 hypothetical protein [Actinomycetota bacterium]MBV9664255.1 hypothetical protein [Actinomycetota bacterium]MBV9936698.1 hypothetical protein [Actinomycetota bacterium]
MAVTQERPVTRADIENKLRQIRGEVDSTAKAAVPIGLAVGAAAVAVVVGVAFLMGRRRGRKRATVVEIRRV